MPGNDLFLAALAVPFWSGFLVSLRIGAIVALMPAFGESSVPIRVKLGLTLAFTIIVAPALGHTAPVPGLPDLLILTGREILIGSAIGLGLRLFVMALQMAGSIAAQSTSLAQMIGGSAEPVPAMGAVLVVTGLAVAVSFGLHVKAAVLMVQSYALFPMGTAMDGQDLAQWGSRQVAEAFRLAFSLAAPFVVASFIYNLTLGVINRAMPQLMVAFVGAPFTTLGGLVLLFLCTPFAVTSWWTRLDAFLLAPFGPVP